MKTHYIFTDIKIITTKIERQEGVENGAGFGRESLEFCPVVVTYYNQYSSFNMALLPLMSVHLPC